MLLLLPLEELKSTGMNFMLNDVLDMGYSQILRWMMYWIWVINEFYVEWVHK